MHLKLAAAALAVFAAFACEASGPESEPPEYTSTELSYSGRSNLVYAKVVATQSEGPTAIECHWTVQGNVVLDTTVSDTLFVSYELSGHPRTDPVSARLQCTATNGDARTPLELTLDTTVVDLAPSFDTLLVATYQESPDTAPWTVGSYLIIRDDYQLHRFTLEFSDSAACPCFDTAITDVDAPAWYGAIFRFIYKGPGTYYLHLTAEDDLGNITSVWKGPLQVPLTSGTAPISAIPAVLRHPEGTAVPPRGRIAP